MKRLCLASLLVLAACSKSAEQAGPSPAASDAAAHPQSEGATPTAATTPPPKSAESRYTRLSDCKLVKRGDGEDWSVSRCTGLGGYDLQLDYGDARDDLALLQAGKSPAKLRLVELSGGGFSGLADTAEWRGLGSGAAFVPTALIVRHLVSENPANSERQTAVLMVIDLRQHCVVGQVRPQAGQNEAARAIADGPMRKCLR